MPITLPKNSEYLKTTIASSITDVGLSLTLTDPATKDTGYGIIFKSNITAGEVVSWNARVGAVLTLDGRGLDGGAVAQAWDADDNFWAVPTAVLLEAVRTALDSLQTDVTGITTGSTSLTNAVFNTGVSGTAVVQTVGSPGSATLIASEAAIRAAITASVAGVAGIQSDGGTLRTGNINFVGGTGVTITNSPAGTFTIDTDASDQYLFNQIYA